MNFVIKDVTANAYYGGPKRKEVWVPRSSAYPMTQSQARSTVGGLRNNRKLAGHVIVIAQANFEDLKEKTT